MSWIGFIDAASVAAPFLTVAPLLAIYRARDQRRFPWVTAYLLASTISVVVLSLILHGSRFGFTPTQVYPVYFYTYMVFYAVSAVLLILVIQELFRHVMAPLAGLGRLGLIVFRWVSVISVIVALASAVVPGHLTSQFFLSALSEVMRCLGILELCLLAFLTLSVHSLGLSFRSRVFGVAFGLGLNVTADIITSVWAVGGTTMFSAANAVSVLMSLVALVVWAAYFLAPEPERKAVTLPVSSPLVRWNDIAMALGHPPPHVVVGPSNDFFLQDVEKVVDKILAKNAM